MLGGNKKLIELVGELFNEMLMREKSGLCWKYVAVA